MDAVEFLKEKNRMCREYGGLPEDCFICPIGNGRGECQAGILENQKVTEEILVQIVEKWAAEHPAKTRQSEFLKIFPNARIVDGVITIEPCDIDNKRCGEGSKWCDDHTGCEGCREDYWLTEVE